MKKYLIILISLFGFSSLGSSAFATGEYFGIRFEALIPSAGTEFSVLYPLLGAEFGVEFDAAGIDVGIRASVTTLIVWFRLALDVYFVLPSNQYGSGAYFGLGGGLFAVPFWLRRFQQFLWCTQVALGRMALRPRRRPHPEFNRFSISRGRHRHRRMGPLLRN